MTLRRTTLASVASAAVLGAATLFVTPAAAQTVEVWKSRFCGCCAAWVEHMRAAGFTVTTHETEDLDPLKARHGVTPALQSCHTAVVEGYVVEGHVPADTVRRLLQERPQARGLAVPGMPPSAPGMDTGTEPYAVVLFDERGKSSVYERR